MRGSSIIPRITLFTTIMTFFMTPVGAQISQLESGRAQGEMFKRIDEVIRQKVADLDIDKSYAEYCRMKLSMETNRQESDGLIPFGVDYNNIKTSEELNDVIQAREVYERSYLILCLSDAKIKLLQTADAPKSEPMREPYWVLGIGTALLIGIGFMFGRRMGINR